MDLSGQWIPSAAQCLTKHRDVLCNSRSLGVLGGQPVACTALNSHLKPPGRSDNPHVIDEETLSAMQNTMS